MSRAELQVRVKEPPGTERSAVRPGSFSLKVVPPDRHLPPTHRRQELRKRGSREASRPAAPEARGQSEKAERPEQGRALRSLRGSPERPEQAGEAEFRYHFSLPEQFHSQRSLRYGDAAWCAPLPGQRGPGPGPRSEHRHALRCPRRRRCARLRPQRERGERAASEGAADSSPRHPATP